MQYVKDKLAVKQHWFRSSEDLIHNIDKLLYWEYSLLKDQMLSQATAVDTASLHTPNPWGPLYIG